MKIVELNFEFIAHIQWFEISWVILQMTEEQQSTSKFWSHTAGGKKSWSSSWCLALEAPQPPARGQKGTERVSRVAGVFHDLGSPSLVRSGGQASLQPSLPFSAAGSLQQSREWCGSGGNTLHICKKVQDWAPNMSQHPEKWRYWQSLFTSCLEKVVWKSSHGL